MSICSDHVEFDRIWPFLEKALAKEIGGMVFTKAEVEAKIIAKEAVVFSTEHSATLVDFVTHPRLKLLNIWAAGGKLREILRDTLPELEAFGRENDFKLIVGSGAHGGWGRALRNYGFEPQHTTFAKDISA